jgi:hypothetical protein
MTALCPPHRDKRAGPQEHRETDPSQRQRERHKRQGEQDALEEPLEISPPEHPEKEEAEARPGGQDEPEGDGGSPCIGAHPDTHEQDEEHGRGQRPDDPQEPHDDRQEHPQEIPREHTPVHGRSPAVTGRWHALEQPFQELVQPLHGRLELREGGRTLVRRG